MLLVSARRSASERFARVKSRETGSPRGYSGRMRALVVLAALLAALGTACGGSDSDSAAPLMEPPNGSMREPTPNLEGVSLDGEPIALEGFRGRPVLVNVWSSW